MDKKSGLAIGLIAVIMIIWMMYQSSVYKEIPPEQQTVVDTTSQIEPQQKETTTEKKQPTTEKYGELFSPFVQGTENYVTINTENYQAVFTNKGGSIVRWRLKHYNKWDGVNVQLINYQENELYMVFTSIEAKRIDSRDLYFSLDNFSDNDFSNNITLTDTQQVQLVYKLDIGNGKELIKTITLYGNKYHIDQNIEINNLEEYIRSGYALIWGNNLNYQEKNSVDESSYSVGLISMNSNITEFDAKDINIAI